MASRSVYSFRHVDLYSLGSYKEAACNKQFGNFGWQQQQNMLANFTLDSVAAGRQWSISAYKYVMRLSISYPVAENLLPGMD